jgi:hypothetical protein
MGSDALATRLDFTRASPIVGFTRRPFSGRLRFSGSRGG